MLLSCGHLKQPQEIIKTVNIYPEIPESWLTCAPEVIIPEINKDTPQEIFGEYSENQRLAGADCRANLGKVKDLRDSWPKSSTIVDK